MKRLLSGLLAVVMAVSLLTASAAAAGSIVIGGGNPCHEQNLHPEKTYQVYKGAYAEQWCKRNNVKYTYAEGSVTPGSDESAALPSLPNSRAISFGQYWGGTEDSPRLVDMNIRFSDFVSTNLDVNPYSNDITVTIQKGGVVRCEQSSAYLLLNLAPYQRSGWLYYGEQASFDPYGITVRPTEQTGFDEYDYGNLFATGYAWQFNQAGAYELKMGNTKVTAYIQLLVVEPTATATPNQAKIVVDGKTVAFDAYNINGSTYFKLRDVAQALKGTDKQFEVQWDNARGSISLTSNTAYTTVGGELVSGSAGAKPCALNTDPTYFNGQQIGMTAYKIGGNNYVKMREIGEAFDFNVSWDGARNTIVVDSSAYYDPTT